MRFGLVPLSQAAGAILAHSELTGEGRLRKGTVLDAAAIARLEGAGLTEVVVARPDADDVPEDVAAARLAAAVAGANLTASQAFTGRVNLNAACPGIVEMDADAIHALNLVHPSITLATLAPLTRVTPGLLTGTVKIISYAVPEAALADACRLGAGALRVRPVVRRTAALVLTEVPGQDAKLAAKGRRSVEGRLRALGIGLTETRTVPHAEAPLAAALATLPGDLILILTGSATSDLHDTAPQAVRVAGGTVARFGMPVDPGNLLFLGDLQGRPVIGLPGCARSPALNGADWVLERLACGMVLTDADIAGMGVGGLLKEIPIRPQVREPRGV